MNFLYHISFNFEGRPAKTAELQPAFDKGIDWIRYAPNCWLVYSSSNAKVWFDRLRPLLHDEDSVFIVRISHDVAEEYQGWLPKLVWDWIYKNSARASLEAEPALPLLPGPNFPTK